MQEWVTFVQACIDGDVGIVSAMLPRLNVMPEEALSEACANKKWRVVDLLLRDPRVYAPVRPSFVDVSRNGLPWGPINPIYAYRYAIEHNEHVLFALLVKHCKYVPLDALYAADDADTLRVLLDKPRVTLEIKFICHLIKEKRVDLLRVVADVPWLTFSRRLLIHFRSLAEKSNSPHVFASVEQCTYWEQEECSDDCYIVHGGQIFHYTKAHPRALAIVWCFHQVTGWADMAEPVLERLSPEVTLKLSGEGTVLGIKGAPTKPPMFYVRAFYVFIGILALLLMHHGMTRTSQYDARNVFDVIFGFVGAVVIVSSLAFPVVMHIRR